MQPVKRRMTIHAGRIAITCKIKHCSQCIFRFQCFTDRIVTIKIPDEDVKAYNLISSNRVKNYMRGRLKKRNV